MLIKYTGNVWLQKYFNKISLMTLKRQKTLRGWEKFVTFLRHKTLRGLISSEKCVNKRSL